MSTPVTAPTPSQPSPTGLSWYGLSLLALLFLGAILRVVQLQSLPPGLWYDEAIYALDGVEAMTQPRIFYDTANHMREPLYIWGLGGWFHLFGIGVWQARLFSAIIGIGILAAFIPLARLLVGNSDEPNAINWKIWVLCALSILVCLRWQVHFSRTIFRAITPTLFLILLCHSFLLFYRNPSIRLGSLSGLWLGLGAYTYLSWRLVPILVILWCFHGLLKGNLRSRKALSGLAIMGLIALIITMPLLMDFARNPDHFRGRTAEVSLFSTLENQTQPDGSVVQVSVPKPFLASLQSVAENAFAVTLMWNWKGDHVGKHNLPNEPVFDPFTGILFWIGIAWALTRCRRDFSSYLVLTTLAVISLASVLSFGAPNILRTQAMIPIAVILVIWGIQVLAHWILVRHPHRRTQVISVILAWIVLSGTWQVWTYFGLMPRSFPVRQEFQTDTFYLPAVEVQNLANSGKVTGRIWVPAELADHPTFVFASYGTPRLRTYPAGGWPEGAIKPGDGVLITQRAMQLATPRNLRGELLEAGINQRVATIPIQRDNAPPVPHAEITLIKPRP